MLQWEIAVPGHNEEFKSLLVEAEALSIHSVLTEYEDGQLFAQVCVSVRYIYVVPAVKNIDYGREAES